MIDLDKKVHTSGLALKLQKFWALSEQKIKLLESRYDESQGSPVFTVNGKYTTRGWTEWTQGFQYGSALLQYDVTGETNTLEKAKEKIISKMAPHISHIGVHDHGFNNVSTYGNLLRLMKEGKIPYDKGERDFYELALKVSGAVQASRWTSIRDGGFIHSFNGPHSLFVDTIRSVRVLILSHMLGHVFQGEGDVRISLLERAIRHLKATADFSVFYGTGRDIYDIRGRTAHECIFNTKDGNFRCPGTQQGYSGFSTWTRGLAWAVCGFAEQLEWLEVFDDHEIDTGRRKEIKEMMLRAAMATCDFYIENSASDGIPYWDTGAPGLVNIESYLSKPADPYNDHEPVDSSAAAIASQGLLRLGHYLTSGGRKEEGERYWKAGLIVLDTLLQDPYLSTDPEHQGLLLHSVYHRPNGWDHIPAGSRIPNGESSMWGDYHIREACLYLGKIIDNEKYYTYFNCVL